MTGILRVLALALGVGIQGGDDIAFVLAGDFRHMIAGVGVFVLGYAMASGTGIRQRFSVFGIAFGEALAAGQSHGDAENKGCFAHDNAEFKCKCRNYTQNSPDSGKNS